MAKKRIPVEERSWQLKYYYDNRAERQAYQKEYYQKHKQALNAYKKEYYLTHKMEMQAYRRALYAKKKAAAGEASSGDGIGNENKAIIAEKKGNVK